MADSFVQKMSKFFKVKSITQNGKKTVVPASVDIETNTVKSLGLGKKNSPKEIEAIWDFWIKNTYDSPDTLKNRFDRYKDLEFMYYNDSLASMAMDLLADETISADSEEQEIGVFSKNAKTEKKIKDFLNILELKGQNLRERAFNLGMYGDSFDINNIDSKKGIIGVTTLSVYDVKQRLEFSLSKAAEDMEKQQGNYQILNKQKGLVDLYNVYNSDLQSSSLSNYFDDYLFGYSLGKDLWVPPWMITHYRRYSKRSEFWPYGKPPFIHMIGPYRQFSSTLNLQAMARIASFPLKHFKVKTDERMTEVEKWSSVAEARREYANLGLTNSGKDEFTINDELWTPEDLLDVDVIENRLDIDKIGDLELLQDRMIASSRIPKNYLPFGDGARLGSESGKALMQQSKVFARFVYINQSALLEGIMFLIKLHFAILGEDLDDFELSLPYPVVEESSDKLRMKNDTLRLAKDIIDNIGQAVGLDRDEALPIEIVKDVFSKYSFLDTEEIDEWIQQYLDTKEAENTIEEGRKVTLKNRYYSNPNILRESYFTTLKENSITEYITNNKHSITSYSKKKNADILVEYMRKESKNKLEESIE